MDHKTCGSIVAVPVTDATDPQSQSPEGELAQQTLHNIVAQVLLTCSRVVVLAIVMYIFAATAWRARREPRDLAFILGAYASLAALLLCLRRAERLTPDSPAAERRWLHFAVWALSATLSCAFAYRVSLLMPPALVVVVCCMTSFVVLFGFYLLVLCNNDHQEYQSVDGVDCDAAGDGKPLIKKTRHSDEIV